MSNVVLDELLDFERLAYYDEKLKVWTNELVEGQVATAVRFLGSVPTEADLPSDPQQGDMYNVESDDINRIWIESKHVWDKYAPTISIKIATKEQIDALFA